MIIKFIQQNFTNITLISFSVLTAIFGLTGKGQSMQVAISSIFCCWFSYYIFKTQTVKLEQTKVVFYKYRSVVEKYAYLFLSAFIVIHLLWSGLIIFLNPYQWGYNHGDASYFAQTLWNLTDGLRPESSYFTFCGALPKGADPRFITSSGYVSFFSLHQYTLPLLLLAPLYAIYPYPPMHVFSLLLVVVISGVPGMFAAIRAMGGSKFVALMGAVGFALLPHTEVILFFKGYFDALALAVMPWVFAALFSRKWWALYLTSFCLATISFPYAYTVMFIGISAMIFFQAAFPGFVVLLIGVLLMKIDANLYIASSLPYYTTTENIPSFFKRYVLDRSLASLYEPFKFNVWYVLSLLQSGAFIALFVIKKNAKWNLNILGLFAITGLCVILMLFRSTGWEVARNVNFIVPVYVCTFKAFLDLEQPDCRFFCQNEIVSIGFVSRTCLFFSLFFSIIWGSGFTKFQPFASHYPFGANAKLHMTEFTASRRKALAKFEQYVPRDASLAFRSEGQLDAVFANRQHVWHMGREPDGVRYYLFFGTPGTEAEGAEWAALVDSKRMNSSYKLIYEDTSTPMLIFENQKAHLITRNEEIIGWRVLRGVFHK